jgi:uncharacterized membrane protein
MFKQGSLLQHLRRHLRLMLLAGLVFAIPAAATVLVLYSLFRIMDGVSEPIINAMLGYPLPGFGFVLTLLILYVLGVVTSHFLSKRLMELLHQTLTKLPGLSFVYLSLRQLGKVLTDPESPALKRVIYLNFPSRPMKTIGFITTEMTIDPLGKVLGAYIPTPPNPTTGFLIFLPKNNAMETWFSLEEGIKVSFSAGLYWPNDAFHASKPEPETTQDRIR